LGLVEKRQQPCGFLAIRPNETIPPNITDAGFRFGHSLLGTSQYLVVHFAFEFYGFARYNVLVKPNNLIVQTVLITMVESGEYFFFAINTNGSVTAFSANRGHGSHTDMAGLKRNLPRILRAEPTDGHYQEALARFRANPQPPGKLLNWVCQDNIQYLDLTTDRLEMTPAAP
jgi:hypothetical protein